MPVERILSYHSSHIQEVAPMRDPSETYGYVLRLFVCGHTAATERTLKRLHQLLEQGSASPYTLKVIDIFTHPEQTEADRVSATPTLLKVSPEPFRRIVGELDNADAVLRLLESVEIE